MRPLHHAIALLLLFFAGTLQAQYPMRPINLVVPFPAASDADLAARNLAAHAPRYLNGQTIVVTNLPGASGSIGTQAVQGAAPDGYTLLLARIASHVILPATDPKTPYRWSDFTQLALLEVNPYVCAVRVDSPYGTMNGLVDAIRKHPGQLNFATVGPGTIQSFGPQYLFAHLDLPWDAAVAVPYKGSAELVTALLAGQVDFACSNLGTLLGHLRSGTLRPLMTTMREPLKELPGVSTARSLGWPEMESLAAWSVLAGPRKLPREVIERWSQAMVQLSHDAGWLAGNEKLGGVPSVRSPADTEAFVRAQYELYGRLTARVALKD
jgi:tripartite-type tricarboxylate transporter receptor subunit TctC